MSTRDADGENAAAMEHDLDITGLDGETRDLLQFVSNQGEAHTSELRDVTGLNRSQLKHRIDKLTRREFIETEIKQPADGGQERRHVYLTERADAAIADGLLSDILDVNTNVVQLRQRLDDVEEEVRDRVTPDTARRLASERVEVIESRLQEQIEFVDESAVEAETAVEELRSDLPPRVEAAETEVEKFREQYDKRLRTLEQAKLEERLTRQEQQTQQLTSGLSDVKTTVDELADAVDELRDDLAAVDETATAGKQLATTVSNEHTDTRKRTADVEQRLDRVADATTQVRDRVGTLEALSQQREDTLESLDEKLTRLWGKVRESEEKSGWFS